MHVFKRGNAMCALRSLVGTVLFCAVPCVAQNQAVSQVLQRGAAAMRNGQPAAAEQAFREAIALAPQTSDAYTDLALVLAREGKLDEAVSTMRQSIALDPAQSAPHLYLGIFLYQLNHLDESRAALQQALSLAPDSVEALTWLGNAEMALGHPERAVLALDRANALAPDDLNLLELRGRAHNQVAHDSYARMAQLDPASWHVHRVQAQLDADEGRHAEAITEYQAALKQQAQNPDLYEALGDEYRATGQLDLAAAAYAQELALAPANPVALYNVGSVDVERGDSASGVPLLQRMAAALPESAVVQYYLARGLAALNRNDEAIERFRTSAAIDPTGEIGKRSYFELSRVLTRLHRTVEARTAIVSYNRIREVQASASAHQDEDWKKLIQGSPTSRIAPSQASAPAR